MFVNFGPGVSPQGQNVKNVGKALDSRQPGVTNWPVTRRHHWLGIGMRAYASRINWRTLFQINVAKGVQRNLHATQLEKSCT